MSPDTQVAGSPAGSGAGTLGPVTPVMVAHLRATKPWVRLMSVVGFVTSGLLLVVGLVIPFVGVLTRELGGAAGGAVLGIVYLLFGCLYSFLSLFLFRYASAIRDLLGSGGTRAMESALAHQKSFWRLVGIVTLVSLCLYAFLIAVLGIVFAIGLATR